MFSYYTVCVYGTDVMNWLLFLNHQTDFTFPTWIRRTAANWLNPILFDYWLIYYNLFQFFPRPHHFTWACHASRVTSSLSRCWVWTEDQRRGAEAPVSASHSPVSRPPRAQPPLSVSRGLMSRSRAFSHNSDVSLNRTNLFALTRWTII